MKNDKNTGGTFVYASVVFGLQILRSVVRDCKSRTAGDEIVDLGTDPQSCCPPVQTVNAECTIDHDAITGKDLKYQVTMTSPFRALYINTDLSDFGTTFQVDYYDSGFPGFTSTSSTISSGINGGQYLTIPSASVSGFSNSSTAIFQITVNSNDVDPVGDFRTIITTTSSGDPGSCCRMAVSGQNSGLVPSNQSFTNPAEKKVEDGVMVWRAYPNPASNELTIDYPRGEGTVSVFDVLGRKIKTEVGFKDRLIVPLSDLAAGVYQVRLNTSNAVSFKKLIIRR